MHVLNFNTIMYLDGGMYKILLYVFIYRVTYKDACNQSVLSCLVREVKALNEVFLTQHIKGELMM